MKKLVNYILVVTTSLLLLSCEKEKYPGAYPYDDIVFYNENGLYENTVTEKDSILVIYEPTKYWNKDLYPMQLWVDNEEIATISPSGYLTGKKEGTVTVYARVMSINGELEESIKYTVKDYLKELIKSNHYYLRTLGFDRNNDEAVSVSEVQDTEVISKFIDSDILLLLAPYMPKLKEVSVYADTTSRTLDLSIIKLRKLNIHDKCIVYARENGLGLDYANLIDYRKLDYNVYKPLFLRNLILDYQYLEELGIGIMPGFPTLDLSQYTNLKFITRIEYTTPSWSNMNIKLPISIEEINIRDANLIMDDPYYKLKKITLSNCLPIEIKKENTPNLEELIYEHSSWKYPYIRRTSFDISTFDEADLERIKFDINIDTLYISEPLAKFVNKSGLHAWSKYIIK